MKPIHENNGNYYRFELPLLGLTLIFYKKHAFNAFSLLFIIVMAIGISELLILIFNFIK